MITVFNKVKELYKEGQYKTIGEALEDFFTDTDYRLCGCAENTYPEYHQCILVETEARPYLFMVVKDNKGKYIFKELLQIFLDDFTSLTKKLFEVYPDSDKYLLTEMDVNTLHSKTKNTYVSIKTGLENIFAHEDMKISTSPGGIDSAYRNLNYDIKGKTRVYETPHAHQYILVKNNNINYIYFYVAVETENKKYVLKEVDNVINGKIIHSNLLPPDSELLYKNYI